MSICWFGGEPRKVPASEILPEMFSEDRVFLPGKIHGGNYLIRIYLNDMHCEGPADNDQWEIDYISPELINVAQKRDPSLGIEFSDYINEHAENFACPNNGKGDFAFLIDVWPEGLVMKNEELVKWAENN